MGATIKLNTDDGHELGAYRATPAGTPKGGVVILQEIFGITGHIRRVADQYAAHGYLAVAPSLFDRVEPAIVLDYADIDRGREIMSGLDLNLAMRDVAAAVNSSRSAGKVAAIGYCWGGAIADLAACRLDIDAAISYYGRMTVEWLDEQPGCPVIYHYGADDGLIPPAMIEQISAARPTHTAYVYDDSGHGFNCDDRDGYSHVNAELALKRSLGFLRDNLS
jgi:carboxymethylenebutenolidase